MRASWTNRSTSLACYRRLRPAGACIAALAALAGAVGAAPHMGRIEGRVRFEGPPPPGARVEESGAIQKTLYLDAQGQLQFAVAYLPDAAAARGVPGGHATIDQRRFVFSPQVLAVRAGQAVQFTNADPANHNVRARDANPANTFSVNTAAGDAAGRRGHRFAATAPDRPVRLSCDIHPWMAAWVYAYDHDRFAVTDALGRFRIDGVSPGRHRLAVRQPAAGLARDLAVDVHAGSTATVEVRFTSGDSTNRP